MLHKIGGLPAHVLLIHAVVVLVPITCAMLVAGSAWPAARRRMGIVTPILAAVCLVLVPITVSAGKWFRDHIGFTTPQLRRHANLGTTLLPWVVGVFVLAVGIWLLDRRYPLEWRRTEQRAGGPGAERTPQRRAAPVWVTALVVAVTVVVAVWTLVTLYRIGESGSKSVWGGRV